MNSTMLEPRSRSPTATQLYSPYGDVRYQSGTLPTDYGFTHQHSDATSGLDYYGARSYDPVAGQFTSADTTLAAGLNRYAYVGGNPTTRTDPSGHMRVNSTPFAHQYSSSWAVQQAQTQPHTYFGSVSAFVSDSAQFFLGADMLRQSFHTIFQDPHASTGDKLKALDAAAVTATSDARTVAAGMMAPWLGRRFGLGWNNRALALRTYHVCHVCHLHHVCYRADTSSCIACFSMLCIMQTYQAG